MIADIALFVVGVATGYYLESSGNHVTKFVAKIKAKFGSKETL